ncbi:hypothetical protein GEOBRER4_n0428 [Citrifermentans bremense]|uniref:Uncharacterized protein n=1 Tax=Citrifermentans bremense TaxID=60035 RepID=A0A6S6M2T1_9BACT|nr:phospholipase D family protein [Citrifermentans bremense]BCG45665.1 hypothetical protein GEOBRER4_n0428 [Citrifermentans bremense]
MKVVAGGLNGLYLEEINTNSKKETVWVKAAIAYASGHPKLFEDCWKNSIPLTFYGRFDSSAPVTTNILKTFLDRKSPNFVCKLVPDIFHAKVIWWGGYGVYIGSANLTDNGWVGNIEAGTFFSQEEIVENGLDLELTDFFEQVDSLAHSLTKEIYDQICELELREFTANKGRQTERDDFNKKRLIPKLNPLQAISPRNSIDRRKNKFLKEWRDTLQILRDIADRVSDPSNQPVWLPVETPKGVQADQFLHAYYYNHVLEGQKARHHEFYLKNSANPERALQEIISWWRTTTSAPSWEDQNIANSKTVKINLSKKRIDGLTENDFLDVCKHVHALTDHCKRVKNSTYGLPANFSTDSTERIKLLSKYLWKQKTAQGRSVIQVLSYVLYGGKPEGVPERIWEAMASEGYKISHLGISSLGEIVGWTLPDMFPPRNGRTSKALKALGYNVEIYSE